MVVAVAVVMVGEVEEMGMTMMMLGPATVRRPFWHWQRYKHKYKSKDSFVLLVF